MQFYYSDSGSITFNTGTFSLRLMPVIMLQLQLLIKIICLQLQLRDSNCKILTSRKIKSLVLNNGFNLNGQVKNMFDFMSILYYFVYTSNFAPE